jgi:ABC-type multidrug transport system fused ATPase/permease subunit
VLGIVCVVAPITLFGRRLRGASRSSQDRVAEIGGLVSEVLGATRIVQAFNQEKLDPTASPPRWSAPSRPPSAASRSAPP